MKLVLVISLLSFTCAVKDVVNIECPSNLQDAVYDTLCIRNETKENVGRKEGSIKINWNYGDKDKGEIHITILGRVCNATNKCELVLFRHNNSSVGVYDHTVKDVMLNCGEYKKKDLKKHSSRSVGVQNSTQSSNKMQLPSCDQIKNVTFSFVYNGCYILRVRKDRFFSYSHYSDPICVNTNFKQESMFQQRINVLSQYLDDRAQVKHVVSNFSRLQVNKMQLGVWRSDKNITHCNDASELITNQYVVLKPCGTACARIGAAVMPCKLEGDDTIECITRNVTDGYYCILVQLNHDPCNFPLGTVWDEGKIDCTFSGVIENGIFIKRKPSEHSVPGDSRAIVVMVFLVLLFVALNSALAFILYNKLSHRFKRTDEYKKGTSVDLNGVDIRSPLVHPQIFLMYSRDCQPFMDVMKIFRSLLKEVLKCEVYDCFDPDYFEDMARIGNNWPGKLIANDNVKIVLIETKCAKLHLQAHIEEFKIAYEDPTAWDDFFMCGLKAVMHNPKYNCYHKLFIARIHGFTSEQDKLKELTPYTRYDIPDAFYHLLSSILQQFDLKVPDDWNHNIHKLREAIKNLDNYEKDNDEYLYKLLIKKEVHGLRKFISRFRHN